MPDRQPGTAPVRTALRGTALVGAVLLAEAVGVGVLTALRPPAALPAAEVGVVVVPPVALGPALVVLLVWAAAVRLVPRIIAPALLNAALADTALTVPVTVFLVAQLNGLRSVPALVALYALASAAWLLAALQPRVRVVADHPLLPLCFAAGAGIVPWGVIALQQLVGANPAPGIRIVTLIALAGQVTVGVLLWRSVRGRPAPVSLGAAVAVSVTAWSAALLT